MELWNIFCPAMRLPELESMCLRAYQLICRKQALKTLRGQSLLCLHDSNISSC